MVTSICRLAVKSFVLKALEGLACWLDIHWLRCLASVSNPRRVFAKLYSRGHDVEHAAIFIIWLILLERSLRLNGSLRSSLSINLSSWSNKWIEWIILFHHINHVCSFRISLRCHNSGIDYTHLWPSLCVPMMTSSAWLATVIRLANDIITVWFKTHLLNRLITATSGLYLAKYAVAHHYLIDHIFMLLVLVWLVDCLRYRISCIIIGYHEIARPDYVSFKDSCHAKWLWIVAL